MRSLAILVLAFSAVTVVTGQGYVQLELGKRPMSAQSAVNRRARLARRQSSTDTTVVPIYQHPNMLEYIVNLTIGTPGQNMGVTLDTGSSDLWVPTPQMCREVTCDLGSFAPSASTSYTLALAGEFNITYAGPGDSDAGDWGTDSVAVGGTQAISNQVFGVATAGFDQHGVLGVGYDSNEASPNPDRSGVYRTVIDNMVSEGIIARKAYSIYLNSLNETTGSIVFGGIDETKYSGPLVTLPLQTDETGSSVSAFYVTLTQVIFTDAVGSSSTLTPSDYALSVLLDTGTSAMYLDASTTDRLALGLGAVDSGGQNYLVPCQYVKTNATVSYTFGGPDGVTITIPISDLIGQRDGNQCSLGISPPLGGVAVMGDTFLRSAYVVLDLDNNLAALAQAVDNQATTSSIIAIPSGRTIPGATITAQAAGTMLDGAAATATGSVPVVSSHRSSYSIATPTFTLGAAATSGVHNAAVRARSVSYALWISAISMVAAFLL